MRSATILAVLVIVAACGPNVPEFMEATIDGALWQAERVTCLYRNQELRVTGSRSTGADTRRAIRLAELRLTGPRTVTLAAGGEQGFVLDQDAIGWDTHVGYSTTETLTGTV
ncbi:MAG: hypothetical protein OEO17_17595, partial [Gemmatimonadota bacterium]|nr:hypothetical protein [Gemmatimonadota bacterium]